MKRKVEFIESYIKIGNDYQWNDNHGELIRCKDCKHYDKFIRQNIGQGWCDIAAWRGRYMGDNDYCSRAKRKENE